MEELYERWLDIARHSKKRVYAGKLTENERKVQLSSIFRYLINQNIQNYLAKMEQFHEQADLGSKTALIRYNQMYKGYQRYHYGGTTMAKWCQYPADHSWEPTHGCGTWIPVELYEELRLYLFPLDEQFIWTWSGRSAWNYMHYTIAYSLPDSKNDSDYGYLPITAIPQGWQEGDIIPGGYALGRNVPVSGVYRITSIVNENGVVHYLCYYSRTTPNNSEDFVKEPIPLYLGYGKWEKPIQDFKVGDVIRITAKFEQSVYRDNKGCLSPWTKKSFDWEFLSI